MDRAGAALARVAADMGTGEGKCVPQHVDEERVGRNVEAVPRPVHGKRDLRHGSVDLLVERLIDLMGRAPGGAAFGSVRWVRVPVSLMSGS